ncbi:MAG: BCCT family transporter [Bacillota bacterium]
MDNNMQNHKGSTYSRPTFVISLIIMIIFLVIGAGFTEVFADVTSSVFDYMTSQWGWSFILGVSIFLFMAIYLLLSPLGQIKLGKDDEEPEYKFSTWFAMLFFSGMGIGLVFWGVSEPIWHYMWPAYGEANTVEALHLSMRYTFFHWGLHPWAVYAITAGSLAYFSYRKGLPMLLSSCLEPILGRKGIEGPLGNLINIIGVFATIFGLATSLGLGAMQIASGLDMLFGIPSNSVSWVVIISVITIAAVISTYTGIDRGIKWLSLFNFFIAFTLMLLVFILGPTLFILDVFTHSVGNYLQNIVSMSFALDPAGDGTEGWTEAWTVFYWAWWIAWAPFVGTFIARISRGRTIRSFVIGVLLAPVVVSIVWLSVFGGAALYHEHFGPGGLSDPVAADEAQGFFMLFSQFPASTLLIVLGVFSVAAFFITSSDSGTYVNGMLTSGGNINPPYQLRITWGVIEGAVAAILLFAGGLGALQTASVVGGFPFMIILLLMLYCLIKSLVEEREAGSLPLEKQRIYYALEELKSEKGK